MPLRLSGSVPTIQDRPTIESEGPEEKEDSGDLKVIKSMAHKPEVFESPDLKVVASPKVSI